jgi:hypothetical protein
MIAKHTNRKVKRDNWKYVKKTGDRNNRKKLRGRTWREKSKGQGLIRVQFM